MGTSVANEAESGTYYWLLCHVSGGAVKRGEADRDRGRRLPLPDYVIAAVGKGAEMSAQRSLIGLTAAAALAASVAVSGCGASQSVSGLVDPVARAAEVTARVPGYRLAAVMSVSTPQGTTHLTMSGTIDRVKRSGSLTAQMTIAGHSLTIGERFSGLAYYLNLAGVPGAAAHLGGKPWLKLDIGGSLQSAGLGGLSSASEDPSQFLDYLRAVSTATTRTGTETIRGVATTQYHATIDLRRYARLVPAAQRAQAASGLATLEAALGSHTISMDVWIDAHKLVRRLSFAFPECIANQHLTTSMTMDLYDYGPQPVTQLPPASQTRTVSTPNLGSSLKRAGCGTSA